MDEKRSAVLRIMNKNDAKLRLEELYDIIEKHNYNYM